MGRIMLSFGNNNDRICTPNAEIMTEITLAVKQKLHRMHYAESVIFCRSYKNLGEVR